MKTLHVHYTVWMKKSNLCGLRRGFPRIQTVTTGSEVYILLFQLKSAFLVMQHLNTIWVGQNIRASVQDLLAGLKSWSHLLHHKISTKWNKNRCICGGGTWLLFKQHNKMYNRCISSTATCKWKVPPSNRKWAKIYHFTLLRKQHSSTGREASREQSLQITVTVNGACTLNRA